MIVSDRFRFVPIVTAGSFSQGHASGDSSNKFLSDSIIDAKAYPFSFNMSPQKRKLDDLEETGTPKRRKCTYRREYTEEWPFMKESQKGSEYIACSICKCDIKISSGRSEIEKHVKGDKHEKNQQRLHADHLTHMCKYRNQLETNLIGLLGE